MNTGKMRLVRQVLLYRMVAGDFVPINLCLGRGHTVHFEKPWTAPFGKSEVTVLPFTTGTETLFAMATDVVGLQVVE